MSTSSYAARVGAAAFLLGVALGAPVVGPAAIAAADSPDTSASDTSASSPAEPAGATPANRSHSGPRAAARSAARPVATDARRSQRGRSSAGGSRPAAALRVSPAPAETAQSAPAATAPASPQPAATAPQAPTQTVAPISGLAVPAALAGEPAATLRAVTAAVAAAADTITAAPATLTAVDTPAGAAITGLLRGLFGPLQSIVEGAAASARRGLASKTLTVNPVQQTGLVTGPITGTIGAIDPKGGKLSYALSSGPQYGSVTLSPDGGYTYTAGNGFAGADSFVVTVTATPKRVTAFKRPTSTQATVSVSQNAQASLLQFDFVYGSGSQYWTPEARSALEASARQLASYLVVTSPVTITYSVTGERKPLSGTLASAGSEFTSSGSGFLQTVVQSKIQTGVDPNGATPDGEISWNFGPKWAFGDSVASTQYDFQSTAIHELTHTLGFLSYIDKAGNNWGKTWTVLDSMVVDSQGNRVINSDYTWNTAYNANLTGGNGGLYFGGPDAVAAYGGLVPLYTPSAWSAGSSVSHLDDSTFTGINEKLMNAVSGTGPGLRSLSPTELAVLADLGYQINTGNPTPTLMFVGLLLTRRMRRKVATTIT